MTLNEYQKISRSTAIYPGSETFNGIVYCTLKLNGEAGEVAELVGKTIRGDFQSLPVDKCIKELGDVLWYISNIASELGTDLETIAQTNLDKLADRAKRGVLQGSGSER